MKMAMIICAVLAVLLFIGAMQADNRNGTDAAGGGSVFALIFSLVFAVIFVVIALFEVFEWAIT